MAQPSEWQTIGTKIAARCGHTIAIQAATNDRGETVTRVDGYPNPDPDDLVFTYDETDLCHACYVAAMDRKPRMSFEQMTAAFRGR